MAIAITTAKTREQEFKAEFLFNKDVARQKATGLHAPSFHANPMIVPPPLRADGKTYCDKCRLWFVTWRELGEEHRRKYLDIVADMAEAEQESRRGRG